MGLCYEILKDAPKAREIYKKASDSYADTSAGKTAQKYLRLLNLN
jgi:hypothetical protein